MPKTTKKTVRPLPKFESEDEERAFWATHEAGDYVNWRPAQRVRLAKLRPTTRVISIRMPETMLERLKILANKRDVPYQSLLKMYVAEKIEEALHPTAG